MNQEPLINTINSCDLGRHIGRVRQFFGLIVESTGPDVFLGERCDIYSPRSQEPIAAEVVGIKNGNVLLMPFGHLQGIQLGSEVVSTGQAVQVPVGEALLGRVVDAFAQPLDNKPLEPLAHHYPLYQEPINPLSRPPIDQPLPTGIKAIDSLLTIGKGQRMGIFSGSGVGKSSLLGMIAKNISADINIIALIGERGREVRDFIDNILGEEGLKKSVVIVATSDQPALMRTHAAFTATAIAEYFRDQGKNVVLTMDSVTRFATAYREIGLAVGEPPTARGYTPSVFSILPKLLERGGKIAGKGTITGLYSVLVEGDDLNDPIADTVRSILDGHLVLSRHLAHQMHYPAIDILKSKSRLINSLQSNSEKALAKQAIEHVHRYEEAKDLIDLGAYKKGANPLLDESISKITSLNAFLCQEASQCFTPQQTSEQLSMILQASNG